MASLQLLRSLFLVTMFINAYICRSCARAYLH